MMPYNTRRKLLSLPSLGIHVPVTHISRAAATRLSPPSAATSMESPPSKKLKRSHGHSLTAPNASTTKRTTIKYENTPPPSPEAERDEKKDRRYETGTIDLEGIKDEIVGAVIIQLQKTNNRPHLVKELTKILRGSVKIVEQSANPSAIVSSRLSAFIKRPWTLAAPCPITKELETTHPRRTHYYLTSHPYRPMYNHLSPEYATRAIISPSNSSADSQSDENDADRRRELSPSPEIDLTSPEYDDKNSGYLNPPATCRFSSPYLLLRNNRSTSPPLERDEKEFTQTARGMQKRKFGDVQVNGAPSEIDDHITKSPEYESFFGKQHALPNSISFLSSPTTKSGNVRRDLEETHELWVRTEADWDMRSPENIDIEEIDGLFDDLYR